jgi:hypothetical protein
MIMNVTAVSQCSQRRTAEAGEWQQQQNPHPPRVAMVDDGGILNGELLSV